MAFDGIVTKAIAKELQELSGARLDKIYQPNPNTVTLGCYLRGSNYAINICTNPQNYRINLTTHKKQNPMVAPNFCMVLRKHLLGLRFKNFITYDLERIITIEFEAFDGASTFVAKKLVIELMGKHCNIVLLDNNDIIIDSLRHINGENSSHIVVPRIKYSYPTTDKLSFIDCMDFATFQKAIKEAESPNIETAISNTFNGISKNYIKFIINEFQNDNLELIFNELKNIIYNIESHNVKFKLNDGDYFLVVKDNDEIFNLNFTLDDFYYEKEAIEDFKSYRDSILKLILATLKKYNKKLENINTRLNDCSKMDTYKLYGELITANLYKIKNENVSQIELENYYDNCNLITIPLDPAYSPSINAKRFFKKYNKLKNATEIVGRQKEETINELNYIESIVYELEAASTINEILEIYEEISENNIFKKRNSKKSSSKVKKSSLTKNKFVNFNPLKYTIDGFTLLVGRNNKENDYLTLKYANKSDIWFHTKDIHGSHAVLSLNGKTATQDVLLKCAEIAAFHSKAKLSSNVPVDFCEVKYVRKPNGAKPGMVIYTNNSTLYVEPKNN